jgi:hypothetical protein
MVDDGIGGRYLETAATRADTDQRPNLDRAATNLSAQGRRDRHRWPSRNGDHRRQLWQVMPMRWFLLCGLLGWLLGRLLCRRLDRTAGLRCRGRGARRRCGGGCAGRRGRAGTWDWVGALLSAEQLHDAEDDQRDQDQDEQGPAKEHHWPAIPRGGLGLLVERVDEFVGYLLLRRCLPGGLSGGRFTGWRVLNHAEVGMPGRLIVEVVRRAVACHCTDGTDPTREPAQNVFTLSTLTSLSARLVRQALLVVLRTCSSDRWP